MTLVVVAGMHRSGTSLAASLLEAIGLDLGRTDTMLPADEANPNGFQEQWPIVRLNEFILESLGGSWDNPPDLAERWWEHEPIASLADRARSAIDEVFEGRPVGPRQCKDPRFSLTLPFWQAAVGIDHVVHVVREPAAVAASLATRNAMSQSDAALLWLRYTCHLADVAPDALVLTHASLNVSPVGEMARTAAALGLPSIDVATRSKLEALVDPALWRERTTTTTDRLVLLAQQVAARLGEVDPIRDLVVAQSTAAADRRAAVLTDLHATKTELDDQRMQAKWGQDQVKLLTSERDEILASTAFKLGSKVTALRRGKTKKAE